MKKFVVLAAALVIGLGIRGVSFAAATGSAYVNLHITITEASGASIIRTIGSPSDINLALGVGTNSLVAGVAIPTVAFQNNGTDVAANWSVWADTSANPTAWALQTGNPGAAVAVDQIRIAGIFYYTGVDPDITHFSNDDCITGTRTPCGASAFADAATVDGMKGINVGLSGVRNLWFTIDAPAAGTALNTFIYGIVVYATPA